MSLRAGCLAILVGLLGAVGLFAWSESQVGRSPLGALGGLVGLSSRGSPTPLRAPTAPPSGSPAAARPVEPTPTISAPSVVTAPTPTRQPTATARPAPTAIPPSATPTAAARQVGISLDDLDRELKQSLAGSGAPLRDPRVRLLPPDSVGLQGGVPISIFQIPVEIEARLSVDDRGRVRVTTSKVQAVGASLPESVATEIGRRIDDQGSRAIADAMPPGSTARRVVVEPDRIRVELGS